MTEFLLKAQLLIHPLQKITKYLDIMVLELK